jgi:hypothetical protein
MSRLSIPLVVLLSLDVGLHVLRRREPDFVPLLAQDAAEVVGAATGLHRHHAGRQLLAKTHDPVAGHASPQDHAAGLVQARDTAAVLPEIDPQNRNHHRPLLSSR